MPQEVLDPEFRPQYHQTKCIYPILLSKFPKSVQVSLQIYLTLGELDFEPQQVDSGKHTQVTFLASVV
jgi:hypothetical protein